MTTPVRNDTMEIETKEYGRLVIDSRQVITFTRGLYAFEKRTTWALIDTEKKPFFLLQDTADKETSFILVNPYLICTDYSLNIPDSDFELIHNPPANDLLVFAIITVHPTDRALTLNLAGPLLINRAEKLGVQTIQQDVRWSVRHKLAGE